MNDPVEEIWDAIDQGELERALELARKLGPRSSDSDAMLATVHQ